MEFQPQLTSLSQETLCHILSFLPIADILAVGITCKKIYTAVKLYLRLCKKLDLCDTQVMGLLPHTFYDDQLHSLLSKCPKLEVLYGLRPYRVENRRLRRKLALSVPGIIDALLQCPHLKQIETNNFDILNALLRRLPSIEIAGQFRNEEPEKKTTEITTKQYLKWNMFPLIKSLHLTKTYLPDIPCMPELEYLYLQWVRFYRFEPFQNFSAPKLKSFVMKECCGQDLEMGYMALFVALSNCKNLERLELVRLSVPGGLIQRVVDESWNIKSFQNLKKLVMLDNLNITTYDIGYLMIAACSSLKYLTVSPGLLSDNFFASLRHASVNFSELKSLTISLEESLWSKNALIDYSTIWGEQNYRMLEHSTISDRGMKQINQLFPNLEILTLSHCPHLTNCRDWCNWGQYQGFSHLRELTLRHCYCLDVHGLFSFINCLENIEVLIFKDMFLAGPKGCSHMGLSEGTGLGMESLIVKEREEASVANFFDEPLARLDQEQDFLNFYNVNNGIQCEHHINDKNYLVKSERDLLLYNDELVLPPSTSFRGPITRHRKRLILAKSFTDAKRFHQSTQTCFSFLQQYLEFDRFRRMARFTPVYCCPNMCVCHQHHSTYVCKDYPLRKKGDSEVPLCKNQATSTNDPVNENEPLGPILKLTSKTLRSLTLISCGVSKVYFYDTPLLEHIEVQACGELETLWYESSSIQVSRININHCPNFKYGTFITCLTYNSYSEPQRIAIKPHENANVAAIKRKLERSFQHTLQSYSYGLLYDFGFSLKSKGHYRENLLDWMRFTKHVMHSSYLCRVELPIKINENFTQRIFGEFSNGSRYEFVTNNPVLAELWRRHKHSPEILPSVMYPPGSNAFKELINSLQDIWADLDACGFITDNFRGCYVQFGDFPIHF